MKYNIGLLNKIALIFAFILPAFAFFFLGESIIDVGKMYLIPVFLFLIGFPFVGWRHQTSKLAIAIYSIAFGMAFVGLSIFIFSFFHVKYRYIFPTILLFIMIALGIVYFIRSRFLSEILNRSSIGIQLSSGYYFLIIIPVFFAIIHYGLYEVSVFKSRFPTNTQ